METDSFFCRLFKRLPQTLFELLDLPAKQARAYRFDSVELKKALRIDGLFVPRRATLPLYFVEVQFQRVPAFYANLFAKVFCYLQENDPQQEWIAVAIFASRHEEPKQVGPYADLLQGGRVKRVYLDELPAAVNPPLGLGIVQLLTVPLPQAQELAPQLVRVVRAQAGEGEQSRAVIELVEELLLSRFPQFDREEVRMKFKLHDLRESKVWKEAHGEGLEQGIEQGIEKGIEQGIEKGKAMAQQEIIGQLQAQGKTPKQIAELLSIPLDVVRRLARRAAD